MFVHDENVFPPEEWDKARARILRRAERARALRELAAALLRPLRTTAWAAAAAAGNCWRAYIRRRERNAAVRELRALDDRALKDIGITRGEIEWVVDGEDARACATRPSRPTVR